jgi:hypothetical protein
MSRCSQWSVTFWLPHQYPVCIPFLFHSCYMPCPSHRPWLDHSNYAWRRVQAMKLVTGIYVALPFFFMQWVGRVCTCGTVPVFASRDCGKPRNPQVSRFRGPRFQPGTTRLRSRSTTLSSRTFSVYGA